MGQIAINFSFKASQESESADSRRGLMSHRAALADVTTAQNIPPLRTCEDFKLNRTVLRESELRRQCKDAPLPGSAPLPGMEAYASDSEDEPDAAGGDDDAAQQSITRPMPVVGDTIPRPCDRDAAQQDVGPPTPLASGNASASWRDGSQSRSRADSEQSISGRRNIDGPRPSALVVGTRVRHEVQPSQHMCNMHAAACNIRVRYVQNTCDIPNSMCAAYMHHACSIHATCMQHQVRGMGAVVKVEKGQVIVHRHVHKHMSMYGTFWPTSPGTFGPNPRHNRPTSLAHLGPHRWHP